MNIGLAVLALIALRVCSTSDPTVAPRASRDDPARTQAFAAPVQPTPVDIEPAFQPQAPITPVEPMRPTMEGRPQTPDEAIKVLEASTPEV